MHTTSASIGAQNRTHECHASYGWISSLLGETTPEFGHPLEVWRHVQELHLTVCDFDMTLTVCDLDMPCVDRTLAQALSQQQERGCSLEKELVECFPSLRIVTVRYPYKIQDLHQETKQRQTDQLIGIARRKKTGLRWLERLKIGWYQVDRECYILG